MARLSRQLTIGVAGAALLVTTGSMPALPAAGAATDPPPTFTFIRPAPTGVPLGVFARRDGRWFARTSGTTTGGLEPTAVDAGADPTVVLPPTSLGSPTGSFDAAKAIFREPVDLSQHPGLAAGTDPAGLPPVTIRVSDGVATQDVEVPLYAQTVTAVRSTTTPVADGGRVTITSDVTDQYGQPVVGAPVRLTGYASGARSPIATTPEQQVGVTDASGRVTFTGPGTGTGPAAATGYASGFYVAYVDLNLDGRRAAREPGFESVVGTVSYAAPGRSFFHSNARIRDAGGVLADSARGSRLAAARGYRWIDQDGHLSYSTRASARAGASRVTQPGHLTWVNAHGAPYNPRWLGRGKFESRVWARIKRRPGLRDVDTTFRQNAALGLSVEWEVKDIRPFTTPAALDAVFAGLAASAQRAYGAAWRSRVEVKVLSNLSGGPAFALAVMRAAHARGFTTIYLPRGRATTVQIPASAHAYVTYVRGAQSGLYAPVPPAAQSVPVTLTEPPLPG